MKTPPVSRLNAFMTAALRRQAVGRCPRVADTTKAIATLNHPVVNVIGKIENKSQR